MKKSIFKAVKSVLALAICITMLCSMCLQGFAATLKPNETPGDVNGDGYVNLKDLVTLAQLAAGWDVDHNPWAADTNGDGNIDLIDVNSFARYLVGYNEEGVDKEPVITLPDPEEKFVINFPNTNKYIYRVGNKNAVALSSLFTLAEGVETPDNVTVNVTNANGEALEIYTAGSSWNAGKIDFADDFTGTATIEIKISNDDYCLPSELTVEVVEANNVTTYSEIKNYNVSSVFLNNITMSSNSALYLDGGATLYGNGFTFDCTNGVYKAGGSVSENYVIALFGANLDNLNVIGKVYTQYGAQASNDYNRALVVSKGNSTITNCYLSNTTSPIRLVEGTLHVKGTTVKGGNFSNIDVRNGHLTIEDVTTINQALGNDFAEDGTTEIIGLGITVYYENVDPALTSVTIKGSLTQYNNISSNDKFNHDYATQFVNQMMTGDYPDFRVEINNVKWVNCGIISLSDNIEPIDNRTNVEGYVGKEVSFMTKNGYVYSVKPTDESIVAVPDEYTTLGQGVIVPAYNFDFTNKNYVAKSEGSNDYCYYENGKVLISMDQGDTFEWDPFILTATKFKNNLDYTVSMNGTNYASGSKIAFNTSGEYTVTYSYTDNYNYSVVDGELVTYPQTYTKTVTISVSVIKPTTKNATFTFGSSNTATEKITVNNKTYISAKGVSKTDKQWGYITVNGQQIFYPITEAQMKKNAFGTEVQVFYYVFKDTVTITDYKDGGTGDEQVYNASTTTMPSNLTVVNGMEAKYTSVDSACVDISKLTKDGPSGEVWDFSASTTVSGTTKYNNYLAHSSPSGLSVKSGTRDYDAITVAQFSYKDVAGATYYYFIGYFMPNQVASSDDNSGGGNNPTCIAEGTLITLADGTKKAVENLRKGDMVMAFDHLTGQIVYKNVIIVVKTYSDAYYKNTFKFDDGTELVTINEHGIFDLDLNKYVNIDHLNYNSYIGHNFVSVDANGKLGVKKLVGVNSVCESGYKYDIVTNGTLNYVAEDTLSVTHVLVDVINSFDFGDNLIYDQEKMLADIEFYGLYDYAEWEEYCDISVFEQYNIPVMKVGISKGLYTKEYIIGLINTYVLDESVQIIDN